jgi:hypothetical protein
MLANANKFNEKGNKGSQIGHTKKIFIEKNNKKNSLLALEISLIDKLTLITPRSPYPSGSLPFFACCTPNSNFFGGKLYSSKQFLQNTNTVYYGSDLRKNL